MLSVVYAECCLDVYLCADCPDYRYAECLILSVTTPTAMLIFMMSAIIPSGIVPSGVAPLEQF
jgi:hypothetical protein